MVNEQKFHKHDVEEQAEEHALKVTHENRSREGRGHGGW